jgi:hypothetical protein
LIPAVQHFRRAVTSGDPVGAAAAMDSRSLPQADATTAKVEILKPRNNKRWYPTPSGITVRRQLLYAKALNPPLDCGNFYELCIFPLKWNYFI